jgi:hypothetical protein
MLIRTFNFLIATILVSVLAACAGGPTQVQPTPASPTSAPTQIVEPVLTQAVDGDLPETDADVPRVSLEEARAALDSGAAVIVDVRSPEFYEASHIPGAISIPLPEIERNPTDVALDKDEWIITYCT